MPECPHCQKELPTDRGLATHITTKHSDYPDAEGLAALRNADPEPVAPVQPPPVPAGPVIIPEWNDQIAPIKVSVVGREITMLRPVCGTCQRGKHTRAQWWLHCKHSPYVALVEKTRTEPQYSDKDANGDPLPAGQRRLVGTQQISEWVEHPIRVQISANLRVNSGVLVEKKRRRAGFIFPEELRTPTYPTGIKNTCEFRDCFRQEGLTQYRYGTFCRKIEAQLVGHDIRMNGGGGALEVGNDPQSLEKQRMQLEAVPV